MFETSGSLLAKLVLLYVFGTTLSLAAPGSALDGNKEYEEVLSRIDENYDYRASLLARSRGECFINLEKKLPDEAFRERFEEFSFPGGGAMVYSGENVAAISWQRYDNNVRYDKYSPQPEGSEPNIFPKKNIRVAFDAESSCYYNAFDYRAYINMPPVKTFDLTGIATRFDIVELYKFGGETLPEYLRSFSDIGIYPQISQARVEGQRCLRLQFLKEEASGGVVVASRTATLIFAPGKAYSLVEAEYESSKLLDGQWKRISFDTYVARYEEAESHPGIWLLTYMAASQDRERINDRISVVVTEIDIGVEIPATTFTLEGLGVPNGTIVSDKRMGTSVRSIYVDGDLIPLIDENAKELILQNVGSPQTVEALTKVPEFAERVLAALPEASEENIATVDDRGPAIVPTPVNQDTSQVQSPRAINARAVGLLLLLVCLVLGGFVAILRLKRGRNA